MGVKLSPHISIDEYCQLTPIKAYVPLLKAMHQAISESIGSSVKSYAIFRYVAFTHGKNNYVSLWCKGNRLDIETKHPRFDTSLGRMTKRPNGLNYRISIKDMSRIDEVLRIILDSYDQTK